MIVTCKKRVPFLWIVLAVLPWVAVIFKDKVMAISFTFSMRKFVENPAALTFLLTLPGYISWIVPPVVNFLADRIWTRWGRRKPFIMVSWLGTITSIALMPMASDFYHLLAAFTAFCIFNDLAGPVESLKLEIVPPAQRATSQAVLSWIAQLAVLVYWVVAIGRFDEMSSMFGKPVSGEQAMYWAVSIGMVVMLLFLALGIKETNPHSALRGQRFSIANVFRGLFSKHIAPVYVLALSVAVLGTGLGVFSLLLITEQWGYTKQEQGTNIFIGGIVNIFLIPLLGLLSNKVGRGKVYVGLVIAGIVVNASMFLYYTFVLFDARPTLVELVVFGEMLSVIGILTQMALVPFVYDFIPRNELGTYAAGSGLVTRLTNTITPVLMGLFVTGYAAMFLGPPGEMVRVATADNHGEAEIQALLDKASWRDPNSGRPLEAPRLTTHAWYATGAVLDYGRGFEIRLRDADSEAVRKQRDHLDTERGKYKARRGYAQNRLRELGVQAELAAPPAAQPAGNIPDVRSYADALLDEADRKARQLADAASPDRATRLAATVAAQRAAENILTAGIDRLDAILDRRAERFRDQVRAALGSRLVPEGDQVLAAAVEPAIIATFPLRSRPHSDDVEKSLDHLHRGDAGALDLRVVPAGKGVALALSGPLNGQSPEQAGRRLSNALAAAADSGLREAMAWPATPSRVERVNAIRMDLRIIEDPLDRHPSPITRVVYKVISVVTEPPTPERRLNALGRNLRRPGLIEHVDATLVPGDDNAVRLMAIVAARPADANRPAGAAGPLGAAGTSTSPATAPAGKTDEDAIGPVPAAVARRLDALLGPAASADAGTLYALAVPAAKAQRMTIASPVLASSYAKQQYDFLIGYLGALILQLIGLGIVFYFLHLVRTGKVRRRGAEEAEATT